MGSDGLLSIYFNSAIEKASVAGIEIKLPALLRIDAGSYDSYSDELAPSPHVWEPDGYFSGMLDICLHCDSIPTVFLCAKSIDCLGCLKHISLQLSGPAFFVSTDFAAL